jgi:hypothetical protein
MRHIAIASVSLACDEPATHWPHPRSRGRPRKNRHANEQQARA